MAGSALKRLMAEHRQLMKNPPEGIVAGPRGDENYFEGGTHSRAARYMLRIWRFQGTFTLKP